MTDEEAATHVTVPATALRSGMFIDILTQGRRRISDVMTGRDYVTITHRALDDSGWASIVRYPINSDVEVVASGDGF
jgi:hypothetical protein